MDLPPLPTAIKALVLAAQGLCILTIIVHARVGYIYSFLRCFDTHPRQYNIDAGQVSTSSPTAPVQEGPVTLPPSALQCSDEASYIYFYDHIGVYIYIYMCVCILGLIVFF